MFGKKKQQAASEEYEVKPTVEKTSWVIVLALILAIAIVLLFIVVKLNHIFRWWLTLPW